MPASREAVTVLLTAALSLTFRNFAATGHPSWLITLLDRGGWDGAAEWLRPPLRAGRFWGICPCAPVPCGGGRVCASRRP